MGMFNYVNYECVCPVCHAKVDGFQTKDGELQLDTVEPTSVPNFYSTCGKCGCWLELTAKEILNFELVVTGKKGKVLHRKETTLDPQPHHLNE